MPSLPNESSNASAFTVAWQLLLRARELHDRASCKPFYLGYDINNSQVKQLTALSDEVYLWTNSQRKLCFSSKLPDVMQVVFDLYLPVLGEVGVQKRVVAHLGQSIDSRIATLTGDSFFVTGEENRKHLHCLRALSDAVIVGAGTVHADNPQLTTRSVPGNNPVRVVIDPQASLSDGYGLFNDGQARTLLIHQSSVDVSTRSGRFGSLLMDANNKPAYQVERCLVPDSDEQLLAGDIVSFLVDRGMRRLFVEGGGVTVSQFFNENALDRLHIAVAPLLVGEGIQALQLPAIGAMKTAHRPAHAIYRMGEDILWDFDVGTACNGDRDQAGTEAGTDPTDNKTVRRQDWQKIS